MSRHERRCRRCHCADCRHDERHADRDPHRARRDTDRPARERGRGRGWPLLEGLEARRLLASISNVFTDFFTGLRTVNVSGDNVNETWTINHNGNGRVAISGPVAATRTSVQQLNVRTNGGIDTVRYNLTANMAAGFILDVDTGDDGGANIAGTDDTVAVNLNGNINASLRINVHTRSFRDRITVSADHDNLAAGVRIASGRTLELNLQAGDQNDTIDVSYLGDMDGRLKIFAAGDGGGGIFNGADVISALVIMESHSGQLSTGQAGIGNFDMRLDGNGGTDTFSALVGDHSGGNVDIEQALVTSGALLGSTVFPPEDKVTRTANVTAQGFQPSTTFDRVVAAPAFADRTITTPVARGAAATLSGIITEPDAGDTFFLDVDWGDGTPAQTLTFPAGTFVSGTTRAQAQHTYARAGRYHVRFTWRDQTGLSNSDAFVVKVLPPQALAAAAGAGAASDRGKNAFRRGVSPLELIEEPGDALVSAAAAASSRARASRSA